MKKILTVSLVAMMAVSAARAEIASKAYVDQQDTAVSNIIGALANLDTSDKSSVVNAINEVNTAVSAVDYSGKADAVTGAGGTHTKITYNTQGIVTAGADLEATDIPAIPLSKISDVTSTAAEVNALHEAGAVKADFEKLHAVTADASELNVLDGITASTAELNILDGVTADASELNILDGATLTTTELNYVDGVTSSIQDQLNAKLSAADIADKADAAENLEGATKTKITYNSQGIVTAGADITLSDVTDVTSTAAEVNALHEAGAVKADFEKLHAVTADASELNVLDGITASTAELNILDGVTADASELNVLDGITASTAELNILDGVTADASDINKLDGLATTATELGYVSGVTGPIQTQLNAKLEAADIADKVDANTAIAASSANSIVQYDAKGLVLSGTPAGDLAILDEVGSTQITDGSVATVDIADHAVTLPKLPAMPSACTAQGAECVLKGTSSGIAWEVIQRATGETPNNATGSNVSSGNGGNNG